MISSPYFEPSFVQQLMQEHMNDKDLKVSEVAMMDVDNSASILAVLASARTEKIIGHFGMMVTFTGNGVQQTRQMVMKIKPHGQEIVEMLNMLAQACGENLLLCTKDLKA